MQTRADCENQPRPRCPECGQVFQTSMTYVHNLPVACQSCWGKFIVSCNGITYTTEPVGGWPKQAPFTPPPGEFSGCRCAHCPEREGTGECRCCAERRRDDKEPEVEPIV